MNCPICLLQITDPLILPCCHNKFCSTCIENWLKIKSTCPLCCAQTSQKKINILIKRTSSEGFDDGSLMLETEIQQIKERVANINSRIANRREQFQNRRSNISASLMRYLEEQIEALKLLQRSMEEHHSSNHRGQCVQNMQLIVEMIFAIQGALQGNWSAVASEEEQPDVDCDDDQSEYDEYDEYGYEVSLQTKGGSSKGKKGKNVVSVPQKKCKGLKQN